MNVKNENMNTDGDTPDSKNYAGSTEFNKLHKNSIKKKPDSSRIPIEQQQSVEKQLIDNSDDKKQSSSRSAA